jgi:uncharacterized damage-inducible protein DinB
MFQDWIAGVMVRDLKCLRRQLEAFSDESEMWETPNGVTNSAGNLAMHLAGNIQHFIGMQLGGSGYRRDRDAEFGSRNVPRSRLLNEIDASIAAVERTIPAMDDAAFEKPYGLKIGDATITTGDFLVHLASHLTYHLGQIDYHRRVVTGEPGQVRAVQPTELSSVLQAR